MSSKISSQFSCGTTLSMFQRTSGIYKKKPNQQNLKKAPMQRIEECGNLFTNEKERDLKKILKINEEHKSESQITIY